MESEEVWTWSIIFVGLIIVLASLVYVVDATERATVLRFGKIVIQDVGAGLHFKLPLIDRVVKFKYTVHTLDFTDEEAVNVLSKDGLPVTMDVSIIYRYSATPADLYLKFGGTKGLQSWLVATTRGTIRDVIARYNVEELYGENREQISKEIAAELEDKLSPYVTVTSVQVRKVTLPAQVVNAIEEKLKAQQEAQRMQYVIQKEKLEMERKKIEAEGIATATEIIAQALDKNPGYMKWYYMKVLEKFAESNNNTIILVPVAGDYYPEANGTAIVNTNLLLGVDGR